MKFLLEHGAKVEGSDLLAAAGANDMASLRLLLDASADPKFKAPNGMTPLIQASMNGNLKMVETLLADLVKALLDAGAKGNAQDVRKMTPLMLGRGHRPWGIHASCPAKSCSRCTRRACWRATPHGRRESSFCGRRRSPMVPGT